VADAQIPLATIQLDPAVNVAVQDEYFNLSVMISDVLSLWSYQIYLSYSPDVLEIARNQSTMDYYVYQGDFLKRGAFSTFWVSKVNNTAGTLQAWESLVSPAPAVEGNGELFRVVFKVKNAGSSFIHLYNTDLRTKYNIPIVHQTTDGIFTTLSNAITQEIEWQTVQVETNSTLLDMQFSQPDKAIFLTVSGAYGTSGFVIAVIPISLLGAQEGNWTVLIDDSPVMPLIGGNSTHSFIYVSYTHSTRVIGIYGTEAIPEYSIIVIFPVIFLMGTVIVGRSKKRTRQRIGKS